MHTRDIIIQRRHMGVMASQIIDDLSLCLSGINQSPVDSSHKGVALQRFDVPFESLMSAQTNCRSDTRVERSNTRAAGELTYSFRWISARLQYLQRFSRYRYSLWLTCAGLLCCNFFGQPGSVSKFPPFLWVKLWVGWVGRGYTEISRYFPASWINWITLVTKIKLLYSLRF